MSTHEPPITPQDVRAANNPFLQKHPHLQEVLADVINIAGQEVDARAALRAQTITQKRGGHSAAMIQSHIENMMRSANQGGAIDSAFAATLAAGVAMAVNDPHTGVPAGVTDLSSHPQFIAKVAEATANSLKPSDAEKLAQLQAYARSQSPYGAGAIIGGVAGAAMGMGAMREGGSDGRRSFVDLKIASGDYSQIQNITAKNFAGSPFEQAGINYAMLDYLRRQDSNFTSQNIVNAASYADKLDFSKNDKAMMGDLAALDRYDPKAKQFIDANVSIHNATKNDSAYKSLTTRYDNAHDNPALQTLIAQQMMARAYKKDPVAMKFVSEHIDSLKPPLQDKAIAIAAKNAHMSEDHYKKFRFNTNITPDQSSAFDAFTKTMQDQKATPEQRAVAMDRADKAFAGDTAKQKLIKEATDGLTKAVKVADVKDRVADVKAGAAVTEKATTGVKAQVADVEKTNAEAKVAVVKVTAAKSNTLDDDLFGAEAPKKPAAKTASIRPQLGIGHA
jgi:hypothetical protein